jgi:hypothetical protein
MATEFNFDTFGTPEQESPTAGAFKNPGDFDFQRFGTDVESAEIVTRQVQGSPIISTFQRGGERVLREARKIQPATDIASLTTGTLQTLRTAGIGATETLKGAGSIIAEPFRLALNLVPEKTRQDIGRAVGGTVENAFAAAPEPIQRRIISSVEFLQDNPEFAEVAQDTADTLLNYAVLRAFTPKQVPAEVGRHFESARQVMQFSDPTDFAKAGGMEGLNSRVIENVVGSLKRAGLPTQAVKSIDVTKFATPISLEGEVIRAITGINPIPPVTAGAARASHVLGSGGRLLKEGAETALAGKRRSFIQDLVRPEQTKKVKEAQVGRSVEKRGFLGLFKKTEITPTKLEKAAEDVVTDIPGVRPGNTLQGNFNAIQSANRIEAEKLVTQLTENNFVFPKQELVSRLKTVRNDLNKTLTGDTQAQANKLIDEFERRLRAGKATGADLLQIRKDFDKWVTSQKGAGVFDPARENAFTIANRAIRQTVNDFLDEKAVSVEVKESLAKQRALFTAMENITPKAAKEADTTIGRLGQKATAILGTKNKAVQALAATVGIGGLGAAATFAPGAAVTGIGGYLLIQGGKVVVGPQTRKVVGQVIEELLQKRAQAVGVSAASITISGVSHSIQEVDELLAAFEQFLNEYAESEE